MKQNIKIEICAGSYQDALTADRFSIDRIELNSALELGGLTPSISQLILAKKNCIHPIMCMVRPRPAGFVYSETEFDVMYQDAERFLNENADGIVFGVLNPNHTVNRKLTERMVQLIHSFAKEAVFHKAFDETPDPDQAMNDLILCGVDRVLTSGKKPDVVSGADLIKHLQSAYGSKIEILPGGGVNEDNICSVLNHTGCTEIHFSAKSNFIDQQSYFAVDARKINGMIQKLRQGCTRNEYKDDLTGEDIDMIKNDTYESAMNSFNDDSNSRTE